MKYRDVFCPSCGKPQGVVTTVRVFEWRQFREAMCEKCLLLNDDPTVEKGDQGEKGSHNDTSERESKP